MDNIRNNIAELDNILASLSQFKKQAFQPMPPAQGGMPPQGGAPPVDPATGMPMDPAMMGGAPPVDPATGMPMDPAMMGGAPPQGGMPPELEQAMGDMMSAIEQVMMAVDQQKQAMGEMQSQLQEAIQKSMELEAQVKVMDKALNSQAPYEPPAQEEGMPPMDPAMMGGMPPEAGMMM